MSTDDSRASAALLDKALKAIEAGSVDEAIALCEKVLSMDKEDPVAWFFLSMASEDKGDIGRAIQSLRMHLWYDAIPSSRTVGHLGILLFDTGLYSQAAVFMEMSCRLGGKAHRWVMYGVCLRRLGHDEESVRAFEKAVELDEAFDEGHVNLAAALVETDVVRAKKHLKIALSLCPENSKTYALLCEVALREIQGEEAAKWARRGIEEDNRCADCRIGLACALEAIGKTKDAENEFREALYSGDDAFKAGRALAQFYVRTKQFDSAKSVFESLMRAWPDNERVYECALEAFGKLSEAQQQNYAMLSRLQPARSKNSSDAQ